MSDLYTMLAANSSDVVIHLSDSWRILGFNGRAEGAFETLARGVLNKDFNQYCMERNINNPLPEDTSNLELGIPIIAHENIILVNDHATQLSWNIHPIGKKNSMEGYLLIGHHVTTNLSIIDKRANARQYLEEIIASLPGIIFWKDENSVYLGCNNNLAKVFGVSSRHDIIGKSDYVFTWSKEEAQRVISDDIEVMRGGVPKLNIEERVPYPDGTTRIFLTNKVPLKDANGKIIGVLGTATDINDIKEVEAKLSEAKERAELANQAKSNFLATMSHELRTPLNAIIGMAQILKSKDLNYEQDEYVDNLYHAGNNLLNLINDILDFAKLEAGKIEINTEPANLHDVVFQVYNSMLHQISDKSIDLNVNFNKDVPHIVIADAQRLRQILINLVGNAIKFTEKGMIKIDVSAENILKNTFILKIEVEDTGIGIPRDKLDLIFDRFMQIESQYSRRFEGAGLGLSICKHLAEMMGGTIAVESQYHQGTKFLIKLPLTIAQQKPNKKRPRTKKLIKPVAKMIGPHKYQILLVEDNRLNQKVAQVMMEQLGCEVSIAENSFKALDLVRQHNYDIAFVDIGLPDMNGLELSQAIRSQEKPDAQMPIIAITAHVLEEDRNNCLLAGMDEVLTKPLLHEDLEKTLQYWLNRSK